MRPSRLGSFLFFAFGMLASATMAQKPSQTAGPAISRQSVGSLEAEVAKIDDERRNAYLQDDAAALDRILADDVTAVAGIGVEDNKASILADVRSGDLKYKKLTYDHRKIRIYGDTAVVTSHAEVVANYKEKDLSGELLVTRVYVKQNGTWKLVSIQSTRIPQPASASGSSATRGESSSIRDRFIGTWALVSNEDRLTDGSTRSYPATGPHGKGYLMYTADGHMCAELMNPDRPAWKDRWNPSDAEKVSAIDGFVAYCGRYEIDEANRVMYHYPEIAWSPNYVGTKQPRPYTFNGDLLTFSDKATGQPGVAGYSITWRKVAASADSSSTPAPPSTVSPNPEMQKVFNSQLGRWSQRLERADGSTGDGEAVWRPGPGGMSLVENEFIRSTAGDFIGLSVTWWDETVKGYRALWCDNKIKSGCLVMSKPAHWEGDEFVLRDEFESGGKKLMFKEIESQITPTTYTLTTYLGESESQLKPTSTIHATKIAEDNTDFPK
jgi:hypothetical protein